VIAEENEVKHRGMFAALIIASVLLMDQVLKIWIKTHFYLGEDLQILPWFQLKFIENNGMAFGLELSSKLLLTLGRIAAVCFFIWLIVKLKNYGGLRFGFMICLALITAGAFGNIIDCVFYGRLFNNPVPPEVATMFPDGGGYAGWFNGRVVDMLYFPFFSFTWPEWVPGIGGERYEFFQYIFNIADSAICVGVLMLIFFYSSDVNRAVAYLRQR